jgi:GNAT superfamily N-acetyltransferase
MTEPFSIRFAQASDADEVARLVGELACYERLEHEVKSSSEDFRSLLADPTSKVGVLLAEVQSRAVGFALFFENFSTFVGRPGLYLEDLFVEPEHRRTGIGSAFFAELFRIARERNYGRIEWAVLDWNESAISFYTKKLGAKVLPDWRVCRVVLPQQN